MQSRKLEIEKMYRYDKKNRIYHIDISLDFYRDVYSDWDFAPMNNRDLDDDLIEFLLGCSYEVPYKNHLMIDFYLPNEMYDKKRENRSIQGIHNYFLYSLRKKKMERRSLLQHTIMYFFAGLFLLIAAYFIQGYIEDDFIKTIIQEGFFIGAWVFIWEIFTILFFQLTTINKLIKHNKRFTTMEIQYHYIDAD